MLVREIKKRRSKRVANKKERKTVTGSVVMPMGALLAAGEIKTKYAKGRENAMRKLLKQDKELSQRIRKTKDPEKRKELDLWMCGNIKGELFNLNG